MNGLWVLGDFVRGECGLLCFAGGSVASVSLKDASALSSLRV